MIRQKKELEASLGIPLEFAEEDDDKLIFTNGHFKTDQGGGSYKKLMIYMMILNVRSERANLL